MARNLRVGVQRGLRQSIGGGLGTGDIFTLSPASFDFARTGTKDSRITFTRASSATYVAADGLIKTTPSGAPRFDHNSATGKSLGLLIEEARTNDITDNYTTGNNTEGVVLSEDTSITNPDGTTVAIKATATATANQRHDVMSTTTSENVNHCFSLFVKKGNYRYVGMSQGGATNNIYCIFDFDTKTITRDGGKGSHTFVESGFKEYANGWFRLFVIGVTSGNQMRAFFSQGPLQIGPTDWLATGNEFMYIWGPQKEEGSFLTSYIPTSGSAVTRAADVAEITGTNFSAFYNQSEGMFFGDFTGPEGFVFAAHDGSNDNRHGFSNVSGRPFTQISGAITNFGVSPTSIVGGGKFAHGYKANDYGAFGDGVNLPATSPTTVPTGVSELALGYRGSYLADLFLNGHIKRLSYFPTRLPDATLQSITS